MSLTTENYLKVIYNLQGQSDKSVKLAKIQQALQLSTPAVAEMIRRLADEQFLTYQPYKGVRLSHKGMAIGQNMVRRHRIWEMYLHQVLKLPWDKIHDEAEALEHASSDDVIDRLDEALGFPKFDPHGDPIPPKDGSLPQRTDEILLSQVAVSARCEVVRVSDGDPSFLSYLNGISVRLGTKIKMLEHRGFDNTRIVQIGSKIEILSPYCTGHIFVKELS